MDEILKSGLISFYSFIEHKPEDDEGGKKDHIHLYIEPAKMLQTDDIKNELKEFDPECPNRFKSCLPFNSSKFDHWMLYGLHDKRYLALKGQSRRFHYCFDDFISSDKDYLTFKFKSIDTMSLSPYADMQDAISQGLQWQDYFKRGTVPIQQVTAFEKAWFLLTQDSTYRNDKPGHIDSDTGEVLN